MRGHVRILAIPMLFLIACFSACSSHRVVTTSSTSSSQTGDTVTKEVPSSKETIGEIQERNIMEPLPPQGDRAIPFHRIPRNGDHLPPPGSMTDNSVK